MQQRDVSLICIGYYADIYIIHPQTLDIQFSLSSKLQPDWISAFCMIRPVNREGRENTVKQIILVAIEFSEFKCDEIFSAINRLFVLVNLVQFE